MKIKYLITVFILISLQYAYAGEQSIYSSSFIENSDTYFFGDSVRVRKEPSVKDDNIIDTLNIGTKVRIIKKSEQLMTIDGYKENWYKISYRKNSGECSAYVWGGLLSIGFSLKGDKLFLVGIKKYSRESGFTAECKLVEKGKLLSAVSFEPHYINYGNDDGVYGYSVSTVLSGNCGLDGIENIFKIILNYEACGYPYGNVWIGYNSNKLYYIGKDTSVAEAGVFHDEEHYIFPSDDRSGKADKNRVILVKENYVFMEDSNDYRLSERKEIKFIWKNYRLNPEK